MGWLGDEANRLRRVALSQVRNRPLESWRETLAMLCTYAAGGEWSVHAGVLARRLASAGLAQPALVCAICAGECDAAVRHWASRVTFRHGGAAALDALHSAVEKSLVLVHATGGGERGAGRGPAVPALSELVAVYAEILAAGGAADVAMHYLSLLPGEDTPETAVLRDRIYRSGLAAASTAAPPFPFVAHEIQAGLRGGASQQVPRPVAQQFSPHVVAQPVGGTPQVAAYANPVPHSVYASAPTASAYAQPHFAPSARPPLATQQQQQLQSPLQSARPSTFSPVADNNYGAAPPLPAVSQQQQQMVYAPRPAMPLQPPAPSVFIPSAPPPPASTSAAGPAAFSPTATAGSAPVSKPPAFVPAASTPPPMVAPRPTAAGPAPPPLSAAGPAAAGAVAAPAAAAAAAPPSGPPPQCALENVDTSAVAPEYRQIAAALVALYSSCLAAAGANVQKKREMEDNSRRLGGFLWRLNRRDVSPAVAAKMVQARSAPTRHPSLGPHPPASLLL